MGLVGTTYTWRFSDRLKQIATSTAIIGGFLFGLGVLLQAIRLSSLGITNVELLRFQYVFTGIVYLITLVMPLAPIFGGSLVFRFWPKLPDTRTKRPVACWTVAAVAGVAVVAFIHYPFAYFVPYVSSGSSGHLATIIRFWTVFLGTPFLFYVFWFFYFPASMLLISVVGARDSFREHKWTSLWAALGSISTLWPFANGPLVAISPAVGGFAPQSALLALSPTASDLFKHLSPVNVERAPSEELGKSGYIGPVLIWHSDSQFYYCTAVDVYFVFTQNLTVLRHDQVDAAVFLHGAPVVVAGALYYEDDKIFKTRSTIREANLVLQRLRAARSSDVTSESSTDSQLQSP